MSQQPLMMQPVPQGMQPVPQGMQPVPQGMQPVPHGMHPVPQGMQPGPPGMQPGPQGMQPGPQGMQPVPQGMQPVPQGMQAQHQGTINWMPLPAGPTGCPPGLEYLCLLDQVLIKQQVQLIEVFIGFEANNKYLIENNLGQHVFLGVEDTDCCTRNCCGYIRPFDLQIFNNVRQEVIHLSRPLRCDNFCFPCCLQELTVEAPPGRIAGYVKQDCTFCFPKFRVQDSHQRTVLMINGPFCQCSCVGSVDFNVTTPDGNTNLGMISKNWSGLLKEAMTDADNFGVSFPIDLDVKIKAVLIGAAFLIDFMFFEDNSNFL